MKLLEDDKDVELVCWGKDDEPPRKWVLEQVGQGDTEGLLVMLTDKVRHRGTRLRRPDLLAEQVDDELLSKGGRPPFLVFAHRYRRIAQL